MHSANVLASMPGVDAFNGVHSASIWLLIGNSAEISLKAAFVKLGGDPERARLEFGHDLQRALRGAIGVGFSPTPQFQELIGYLAKPHKGHHFRYLESDDPALPVDMAWVMKTLLEHIIEVTLIVYPEWKPP